MLPTILVIEDNASDVFLLNRALKQQDFRRPECREVFACTLRPDYAKPKKAKHLVKRSENTLYRQRP